jgi:hypothetical protein
LGSGFATFGCARDENPELDLESIDSVESKEHDHEGQ